MTPKKPLQGISEQAADVASTHLLDGNTYGLPEVFPGPFGRAVEQISACYWLPAPSRLPACFSTKSKMLFIHAMGLARCCVPLAATSPSCITLHFKITHLMAIPYSNSPRDSSNPIFLI